MTTGRHPRLPSDDLAITIDEIAPSRVDPPADESRFAFGSGDHPPTVSLEAVDMANTEWARQLEARLHAAEHDAATARSEAARAARWLSLGLRVLGLATGVIGIGAIAVIKLAVASGDKSATDRQHMIEHVEARASIAELRLVLIPAIHTTISANAQAIANLRGTLDTISRLGAVRVQGPPPQPLIPQGDP